MKIIGIILINIASVFTGLTYLFKLKEKCSVSSELITMADLMCAELSFSASSTEKIISRLAAEPSLSHLYFLKEIDFENISIKTPLDSSDNEQINLLFKELGKSDVESTVALINSFRESMQLSHKKYEENYRSHYKLCIAFGVLGGLAVTVILV
ncbi:MAG: stage III sporulation protein AB [Eubacterium sp.]|nr:stage III sporulation protein AB [Eubacterium sp.]